jgi:hypothetical protein
MNNITPRRSKSLENEISYQGYPMLAGFETIISKIIRMMRCKLPQPELARGGTAMALRGMSWTNGKVEPLALRVSGK